VTTKRIVILGGGTGGTMTANRLRSRFDPDEAEIHVVDRDDHHVYQPGLLFVPFGLTSVDEIVRPRRQQLRNGVVFHETEVGSVELDRNEVVLADASVLPYDVLIVASGARLQPEETDGLTGLERARLHLLRPGRRGSATRRPRPLRRRPAGREPRRHADQVPGRPARVHLPRRLAPARAGDS
jgi:NADPH-dependent 2,4-dienoyl-CoA reductase/sulfur reductase-like enzyme